VLISGTGSVIALISLAYLEEDGILLSIALLAAVIVVTIVLVGSYPFAETQVSDPTRGLEF